MKSRIAFTALAACLSIAPATMGQAPETQHQAHQGSAIYVAPTPEQQERAEQAAKLRWTAALSLHAGRYAEAEAEARDSLSLADDGAVQEILAAALTAEGKDQEALRACQTVVEHYDRQPRNLLPYALLLLNSGHRAQAVTVYNQAISQFSEKDLLRANSHFTPDIPEPAALAVAIHIARGVTYNAGDDWAGEGQHKEMMAEFSKALKLAPDSDLANYYYGFGWRNLEPKERAQMGSMQQAKAALQKAILLGKGDVKKAAQKALNDFNKPA